MALDFHIISLILLIPAIGSVIVYLLPLKNTGTKIVTTAISLIPLILSFILLLGVISPYVELGQTGDFYALESADWIPQFDIHYTVGVDALSAILVFLATLLVTLAIVFSWNERHRHREFNALLLFMEVTIVGVFVSLDNFLFFLFWEAGLVPMYFMIAVWGGPNKRYAAIKFFLYTQAASLLVLAGIFAFYFYGGTFSMITLMETNPMAASAQNLLFVALLFGFGTKLPMVPVHTWLPDAHVEAPTAGSVLLAGVMLKLGGYGLIRFNVQMLPDVADWAFILVGVIGVFSMVYGAFVCLAQDDLKRMIAFSSISHMGIVMLGISAWGIGGSEWALAGAIFQMFAHGLISAALFMIAGSIGHNVGTRNISELGGIAPKAPRTSGFMMVAFLASLGLPGLVGFVAEFTVFIGTYEVFGWWIFIPIISVVVTAAYYLFAMQRAIFGPFNEKIKKLHDMKWFEVAPLSVLSILFAVFGILPFLLMNSIYNWVVALG
ncbi:MAG: NADH-quinone oxidoreductase subunit M [Methanomassiliicoccales archaeon]|nr:MAG: NADH-quinone oxidoreductase subunit M [Methanomassiliicoccales archaeon]